MIKLNSKWLAPLFSAALLATPAFAQDSQAIINVLVKKGVITDAEAKQITAEAKDQEAAIDAETSGDKWIKHLVISGRFQTQYVGLGTEIAGNPVNPVSTEHFLLRRIYLGATASFGDGFSGVLNYDLANSSFDKAYVEWKQSPLFVLDAGFSKAPFGYEGAHVERRPASHRALPDHPLHPIRPNNGRRLGASSYRTGLFASGTEDGFFYSVAVTNPERNEYSGDGTNTVILVNGQGGVGSTGAAATNKFAYYGTVGYGNTFGTGPSAGSYKFGYETGFLPDQGGPAATIGTGRNITLNGVFGDLRAGGLSLMGEWEEADDDSGISNGHDAKPSGYWIQPAFKFTPQWEGVVRYSIRRLRRPQASSASRTASALWRRAACTMNKMDEWYFGFNWYIKGNDVKLQGGYIHGESNDTVTGHAANAKTDGFRSQVQVNF